MLGRVTFLLLFVATLLGAGAARAEERHRVVVDELEGTSGPTVRNALLAVLLEQPDILVVRLSHAQKVAGGSLKEGAKTLARQARISAIIEGSVESTESEWTAKIRVRSTGDAEIVETQVFRAPSRVELKARLKQEGWKQLGPALSEAELPRADTKRVVVLPLAGPDADRVRARIQRALGKMKGVELVADASVESLPADAGAEAISKAARSLGAALFVGGAVKVKAGKATLLLTANSGAEGKAVGEAKLSGFGVAGLERAIDKSLAAELGPALSEAEAAAPPEEEIESVEEDSERASAPVAKAKRPSPLELTASLHAFTRRLRYTDDLFGVLRGYNLSFVPAARLDARWYPVAHFQGGIPSHIGISASYERGFLLRSKAPNGDSLDTTSQEWSLGLRGRIPLDPHELGVDVAYGVQTFSVDDDPLVPLVPDVRYRYVRLGVDGRARFDKLSVGGRLGYRIVSSAGDIGSQRWFPNLDVGGADASLFGGWALTADLDLIAGVTYRRYFFSLNPEPGDAHVAGGALDQYVSGFAGVSYRLPGAP